MALTLHVEQRLERVGLVGFFTSTKPTWQLMVQEVYTFVSDHFPAGTKVRRDDVAQNLLPLVLVNQALTNELDGKKLKQKYWRSDFCDLAVDRCWDALQK